MLTCFSAANAASNSQPGQAPSHIQVLAASCAACHGPQGNSLSITPVLAGLDRDYFVLQMQAFQSGQRKATVMHQHAKGLTTDEIEQLGQYFSQQTRNTPSAPVPQVLQLGPGKNGLDTSGHDINHAYE